MTALNYMLGTVLAASTVLAGVRRSESYYVVRSSLTQRCEVTTIKPRLPGNVALGDIAFSHRSDAEALVRQHCLHETKDRQTHAH